jgi:hypothetical protein
MIVKVRHLVRVLDGPLLGDLTPETKVQLDLLRRFNRRVGQVEQSGFWKRYAEEKPSAVFRMEDMRLVETSPTSFDMIGRVDSFLEGFDSDEIAAFVLAYRQFTQRNDPISISSLSKIYAGEWVPKGAREGFEGVRAALNRRLEAPTVIMFEDHRLRLDTLMDVVVYGGLAHANTEKAEVFKSWEASGIMGLIWAEFAYLRGLMQTLQQIRWINSRLIALATPSPSPDTRYSSSEKAR